MKFVSEYKELTGKTFDTVEACQEAEQGVEKQRKALSAKEREASKLRKSLASDVDKAEKNLSDAYSAYDEAKNKVKALLEEFNKQRNDILEPAKKAVRDAEAARTEAIINYNKQCGPYQKTYTGDKAKEEYLRMSKYFDSMVTNFWKDFFNF